MKVDFQCMDCGIDTRSINEYYMLKFELWESIVEKKDTRNLLCIGCVEKRLGRTLNKDDFLDCPVNTDMNFPWSQRSRRLINRLGL